MDRRKKVRFSRHFRLAFIPKDKSALKAYSPNEFNDLWQGLVRDILHANIMLKTTPSDKITQDTLALRIGLEKVISQNAMRQVKERRRAHSKLIRQKQGVLDMESLARVSENSSRLSKDRAQMIASFNYGVYCQSGEKI